MADPDALPELLALLEATSGLLKAARSLHDSTMALGDAMETYIKAVGLFQDRPRLALVPPEAPEDPR
jgi:hypothetical protein